MYVSQMKKAFDKKKRERELQGRDAARDKPASRGSPASPASPSDRNNDGDAAAALTDRLEALRLAKSDDDAVEAGSAVDVGAGEGALQ